MPHLTLLLAWPLANGQHVIVTIDTGSYLTKFFWQPYISNWISSTLYMLSWAHYIKFTSWSTYVPNTALKFHMPLVQECTHFSVQPWTCFANMSRLVDHSFDTAYHIHSMFKWPHLLPHTAYLSMLSWLNKKKTEHVRLTPPYVPPPTLRKQAPGEFTHATWHQRMDWLRNHRTLSVYIFSFPNWGLVYTRREFFILGICKSTNSPHHHRLEQKSTKT